METAAQRYIAAEMPKIEGWLHRHAAELIVTISEAQRQGQVRGAVGEIGVHHGKLLILLLLTAEPDEPAFAVDVFENQQLNVDGSGKGDRARFSENVQKFSGRENDVLIIAKSSLYTSPHDIVDKLGLARLVSIDGGHTAECTKNDLQLAEAVLHDRGVVVLDDYFNGAWPDVATGAAEYLLEKTSKLRPFAVGPNKLFLSALPNHACYRKALRSRHRSDKVSRMFRTEVDLYRPDLPVLAPGELIRLGIKESAIGPYAISANAMLKRLLRVGRELARRRTGF